MTARTRPHGGSAAESNTTVRRGPGEPRSEIRDSDISELSNRVAKKAYRHYLLEMNFIKLRGFVDQTIRFDFPVTALIGPNGGGKTTVLSAAALIHRDVKTTRAFPRSGSYDDGMRGWKINYRLLDGRQRAVVERTASYAKQRWGRGEGVVRPIEVFGVERTVPASERKNFLRFMGGMFSAIREVPLSDDVVAEVNRILAKGSAEYRQVFAEDGGDAGMLTGRNAKGAWYSEFHFGAGEASVVRMVSGIEAAPDESLILIEEIENGLHPVATVSLVEYLVKVALRKRCQVIFTTHSNDALEHLPPMAIWLAYNGKIAQGKLDVKVLRTLTGRSSVSLVVFVEDRFGEEMVRTALRCWTGGAVDLPSVQICAVEGAGKALNMHREHEISPAVPCKSVCVVDGDQRANCHGISHAVAFPGNGGPEQYEHYSKPQLIEKKNRARAAS